jgi:hypothetical protein
VSCQYFYLYAVSHLHREEFSVSEGIVDWYISCEDPASRSATLDSILRCCADPSKILTYAILATLTLGPNPELFDSGRFFSCISMCLQKLSALDCIPRSQRHIVDPDALRKHPEWLPDLVRILFQNEVDPNTTMFYGRSFLQCVLRSGLFKHLKSFPGGHVIRKKFLTTVIETGADVTHLDHGGFSAADDAWACGHWDVWCEALQENGLSIVEVDRSRPQGYMISQHEDGTEDSGSDEWVED